MNKQQTCNYFDTDTAVITAAMFPSRTDTVRAAVLLMALQYKELTSLDSAVGLSTTRLAAVIHALETIYGWHFKRAKKVVSLPDGRAAWVTAYSLPTAVLAKAWYVMPTEWYVGAWGAQAQRLHPNTMRRAQALTISSQ
jgi:hypothetical protein